MSRRPRGRGRKPQHNHNKGNNPNRALDSNGPDVRVRGSAKTIYDKYMSLAHDASVSGRRVKAESYLQHAEHYLRIVQELAIVAEKKAAQQKLQTEQREAEQAARRAKHAAQVEKSAGKKAENAAKNKSDNGDQAQETKVEKPEGDNGDKPKNRARSYLNRRRAEPDEASAKSDIAEKPVKVKKTRKPKKAKSEDGVTEAE